MYSVFLLIIFEIDLDKLYIALTFLQLSPQAKICSDQD